MTLMKRKRAGLDDAMSVVTRFVNACNRHDADAVYSCLHPDFDSIQPMFPTRNFRGADQVRRNWQAIFDAEPGFRLTVLRSAATEDTVWLELHGAGDDAEVAGVFVMGIQGDRIRWARIYSGLVEPVPAGTVDATASRAPAPPPPATVADGGEVVEEALIAPVVDIEQSGRRRRRGLRRSEDGDAGAGEAADEVPDEPAAEVAEVVEETAPEAVAEPEPASTEPVVTDLIGNAESETQVPAQPADDDDLPEVELTAAHDMLAEFETEPDEPDGPGEPDEPEPPATTDEDPPDDHSKWRFGKKR